MTADLVITMPVIGFAQLLPMSEAPPFAGSYVVAQCFDHPEGRPQFFAVRGFDGAKWAARSGLDIGWMLLPVRP